MRIRHLSIKNFRGIRELEWPVPDESLICLIGRGDSTKSTILEALRRAFYPQWNLAFDDADFYQCVPANAINIEVVVGGIPDSFRDLESYGHWLSGWDGSARRARSEPGDGLEDTLRVRLSVHEDLEPEWRVIKSDDDGGIHFKASDRAKVGVSLIGALSDRHLTWGRGSLLGRLTEGESLSLSLASAGRAAKLALEALRDGSLNQFDTVASKAEQTARSLGVNVSSSYKAGLDSDAINVHVGGLTIHDGDMPLRQLGLGSKRMLMTGLQRQSLRLGHITLFDELEIGLEPHRIARLVEHLKEDTSGQYIVTTHSPVVLRELTIRDLHIVHRNGGRTEIVSALQPAIADSVQGKMRSGAESFLAPKIVVCEGATEAGLLRGLDDHWIVGGSSSFAYHGVALFDAVGASKIRQIAADLRRLSYDVAVLADSDAPSQFSDSDAEALRRDGVFVTKWSDHYSVEERIFLDLPWEGVICAFELACEIRGESGATVDQVSTQLGQVVDRSARRWTDSPAMRRAIGQAAKAGDGWFKRQDHAQRWAQIICAHLDDPSMSNTDFVRQVKALRAWIERG